MENDLQNRVKTKIQEKLQENPTNKEGGHNNEVDVRIINYTTGEIGVIVNKLTINDTLLMDNGGPLEGIENIPNIVDNLIFSSVIQNNSNDKPNFGGNKNTKTRKVMQKIIPTNHLYTIKHYK